MSRNISDLHPRLQAIIPVLIEACRDEGLIIGISECMRTVAEQDALYAQGRTAPGNKVTNAKGSSYSSMHQWGVAFDFYRNDGAGAYNDGSNFFARVGAIGKSFGLEWGGDWKSIVDKPHFQLPDWGSTATVLKNTYGTPDRFISTWSYAAVDVPIPTPTPTPTPTEPVGGYNVYNGVIQKFDQNVRDLQWCLNEDFNAGLKVDGIYGQNTEAFLLKVGLSQESCRPNGKYLFKNTVSWIQCRVGYPYEEIDGKFGPKTAELVATFRNNRGLGYDGVAEVITIRDIIIYYQSL